MRICCLNNYPLEKMWSLADEGQIPRQHVWGVDALSHAGHTVTLAPFEEPSERRLLAEFSYRTRYRFGQLDQENFALRQSADLFYSADQGSARGLALIGRVPVVSVLHHLLPAGFLSSASARRHAGVICLSDYVRSKLPESLQKRSVVLPWGPDLDSPLYRRGDESLGVVSAGKSNRDLATLVSALARTGDSGLIYDSLSTIRNPPKYVTLVQPGQEGQDPASPGVYLATRVIADLARASVVAIPVKDPNRLTGLTEINDALALGKPVIVTKSPFLPRPVSDCGGVITVEPGDVDGWIKAVTMLKNPDKRQEMGELGREFAEKRWNYSEWGQGLKSFIEQV